MRMAKAAIIRTLLFALPFIVVICLWEFAVYVKILSPNLVPSPSLIIQKFHRLVVPEPVLVNSLYMSFYRLMLGYALGVLMGISLGVLMGISNFMNRLLSPILGLFISIPTLAWVPLLLVTLGPGEETVIVAIFLGSFFPIVYNTLNGIRSVNKHHVWASRIMGADRATVFFEVLLPGSLVSIITGLRLAIGYSWRALVGAEMLAAGVSAGVGQMIYAARAFNDVEAMFAGLAIIAIGGLVLDRLLMDPIERKTVERWGLVKER